ncbi:exodeoxyribonuclease VII small subunit [[Eubacterium] cellulosolvens]
MSENEEPAGGLDNAELSFEQALEKLEGHVRTLEQGELTLNESLSIFEEGMKLAKFCNRKLDEAEQKIEVLLEKNGGLVKEKFNIPEDEE